jgi:exopolyphosphatase/guanosine-5'-triphosphate,3'-diphosphate pyrophosphatase
VSKSALKQAELAARVELETIAREFSAGHWKEAVGSSGTARTIGEVCQQRGWSDGSITADGLERLRTALLKAGDADKLDIPGLRPDRAQVLAGGVAIMSAVFSELKVRQMKLASGAMRQGILYDMLGRFHHHDMRDTTVTQFAKRYHVDARQARRIETLALALLRQLSLDLHTDPEYPLHLLSWAARLHEIGLTVAYSGYHKHSAYILTHADMPGFSRMEQGRLSLLVLAHRGNMEKMKGQITNSLDLAMVMALRLAVLFHRSRSDVRLPPIEAHYDGKRFQLSLDPEWLADSPLTVEALKEEIKEWKKLGIALDIVALEHSDSDAELAA